MWCLFLILNTDLFSLSLSLRSSPLSFSITSSIFLTLSLISFFFAFISTFLLLVVIITDVFIKATAFIPEFGKK